jgi:hypothetical protein
MAIGDILRGAREAAPDDDAEHADTLPDVVDDTLPEDPKPTRRARARSTNNRGSQPSNRVTAAQRKAVHDALEMMIVLPAGIAELRDPYCGAALSAQADAIVDRLTPIVCRNAAMLAWFTEGAGYLDWLGLATAIWPVLTTVWAHHVTHSIGQEGDGHGERAAVDDFSQYSAPAFSG